MTEEQKRLVEVLRDQGRGGFVEYAGYVIRQAESVEEVVVEVRKLIAEAYDNGWDDARVLFEASE